MNNADPIVDEIRAVREAHAKKFGYDLKAIVRDLKRIEKKTPDLLVRRTVRKPIRAIA